MAVNFKEYIETPTAGLNVTVNGTYDVTEKASVNVSVPAPTPAISPLSVTANGTYTAPEGVDGYSPITVNVGGGGQGWQRPSAWGEYPLEFQEEKAKEDAQRTMEAIYLLYHHDAEKYGEIASFAGFKCTINGGFTVERGHMVGSTFTVDSTSSMASSTFYTEQFTSAMPEYIIYRIKPTVSGNTFLRFTFGHIDADLNAVPQRAIETYGRTHLGRISSLKTILTIHVDVIAYGTVVSMRQWFYDNRALASIDVSNWDVSAVRDMLGVFYGCGSLQTLDVSNWDVSAVTNMWDMFCGCGSLQTLDVSNWDVSAVTDMLGMFYGCGSLQTLDVSSWDTSAVTNMENMFYGCSSLTSLDASGWDTSAVTNMENMFRSCTSLTSLDASGWDTSAVTNINGWLLSSPLLINLIAPIFYKSVILSGSAHLSHGSLMSVINNLATVSTTQTLTLGNTNGAKLTAEEIAIATNKGWTIA